MTGVPYTVVNFAFYYENFLGVMKPQKNAKGEFVLGKSIDLAIITITIYILYLWVNQLV